MATWGVPARPSLPASPPAWARLSLRGRLALACVLSILPLGLLWTVSESSASLTPGIGLMPAYCNFGEYAYQYGTGDGPGLQLAPLDPSQLYPSCGDGGGGGLLQPGAVQSALGYQTPVRLFFVIAALTFGYAALVGSTPFARRLVRLGVASSAVAAVLAVSVVARGGADRAATLCTLLALALTVTIVWSRRAAQATVSNMTTPSPGGYPDPNSPPPGSYPQQGYPAANAYASQGGYPASGAYPPPSAYPPADQAAPYGGPPQVRRSRGAVGAVVMLALVSVVAVIIGQSMKVDGATGWHNVQAWSGLAVVGALLTLAPALAGGSGLGARRTWQVAACGAGALVLFWVLFVLPAAGTNASLVVTIGVAAGVAAAWIAPGRTTPDPR